jgi:hypothetical protein
VTRPTFRRQRTLFFLFCTCLLSGLLSGAASPAWGQANATDAALDGYVTGADGAALPGVSLMARHQATNTAHEVVTDAQGYFRFPLLAIGEYTLRATLTGFNEYQQTGIVLNVGRQVRVNVALTVGALSETVNVAADASVVQTQTDQVAMQGVVNARALRTLPIVSRNIYNFSLMAPGVKGLPSSGFGTTQFAFGGTNRSTWSLDGLDNTQRRTNRQIRLVINTPEAIEEIQTVSNGFSAEFGRSAGGLINVITRSGSNATHGAALFLYRPREWSARPSLAATKPQSRWKDAAVTLSGPIRKDRAFYFGQYEYNPLQTPAPIAITEANARAIGLTPEQLAPAPFGETFHTAMLKSTFNLNEHNSGFLRFSRFTNDSPANGGGGLTVNGRSVLFTDRMFGVGGQLASDIGGRVRNELRAGLNRRDELREPEGNPAATDAFIDVSNVALFGNNSLNVTHNIETSTQVIDNLSFSAGRHFVKAGVDYQATNYLVSRALTRQFVFQGLPASGGRGAVSALDQYLFTRQGALDAATGLPFTYSQLRQTFGEREITKRVQFINAFVQDELRLNPNLSVSLGLRYEYIAFPELDQQAPNALSRQLANDGNNIAPRLGLSYTPFGDGKTVIRGGYGIYYDTPSLALVVDAAQLNGRLLTDLVIPGSSPGAPRFPAVLEQANASFAVKPSITVFSPDFEIMYAHQANVQVERALARDLSLRLQYSFSATRQGPIARDINLGAPIGQLEDGRPLYPGNNGRPDAAFGAINRIESISKSNYHALDVTVTRRFAAGVQFTGTYSWSHALADSEQGGTAPSDPSNLARDYGSRNSDLRHSLVLQGMWAPSFSSASLRWLTGFDVSTMVFYNSGFPVNVASGVDLNGDLVLNDRPLFVGRNSAGGPGLTQVDFRVTRRIPLGGGATLALVAETENLFNHLNPNCSIDGGCTSAVVNRAGQADFGRVVAARNARNLQVGARLTF